MPIFWLQGGWERNHLGFYFVCVCVGGGKHPNFKGGVQMIDPVFDETQQFTHLKKYLKISNLRTTI